MNSDIKETYDLAVDNLLENIIIKYNKWMPDSYRECNPILVEGRKFVKVIEDKKTKVHFKIKFEFKNLDTSTIFSFFPSLILKPLKVKKTSGFLNKIAKFEARLS